jgi:hypothetical protein
MSFWDFSAEHRVVFRNEFPFVSQEEKSPDGKSGAEGMGVGRLQNMAPASLTSKPCQKEVLGLQVTSAHEVPMCCDT